MKKNYLFNSNPENNHPPVYNLDADHVRQKEGHTHLNKHKYMHLKMLEPSQIKSLIHQKGELEIKGRKYRLKHPSYNDEHLQDVIQDPSLTSKQGDCHHEAGECKYVLHSYGKTIHITIECIQCEECD